MSCTQKAGNRCDICTVCVAEGTLDSPLDPHHGLVSLWPAFMEDVTRSQSTEPMFMSDITCSLQSLSHRAELIIIRVFSLNCAVLKYTLKTR